MNGYYFDNVIKCQINSTKHNNQSLTMRANRNMFRGFTQITSLLNGIGQQGLCTTICIE